MLVNFHVTSLNGVNVLFLVSDVVIKRPSKDVLTFQKDAFLSNCFVWSLLVFVLVAGFIIALIVALIGAELNHASRSKEQLCYI
jgi:hypothetical protein